MSAMTGRTPASANGHRHLAIVRWCDTLNATTLLKMMLSRSPVLVGAAFFVTASAFAQGGGAPPMPAPPRFDVAPKLLVDSCPPFVYPEAARVNGQEGKVTVFVAVSAEGKPTYTSVLKSSGSQILDQQTRLLIEKCQFSPATLSGRATYGQTAVAYAWKLEN